MGLKSGNDSFFQNQESKTLRTEDIAADTKNFMNKLVFAIENESRGE